MHECFQLLRNNDPKLGVCERVLQTAISECLASIGIACCTFQLNLSLQVSQSLVYTLAIYRLESEQAVAVAVNAAKDPAATAGQPCCLLLRLSWNSKEKLQDGLWAWVTPRNLSPSTLRAELLKSLLVPQHWASGTQASLELPPRPQYMVPSRCDSFVNQAALYA